MRLICIGDSLTFGYGVHLSQRWTQLCAQETGWELVNEGINGAKTTKTLVREELNIQEFETVSASMRSASIRAATLSNLFLPIVVSLGSLATAYALWQGGTSVIGGMLVASLVAPLFVPFFFRWIMRASEKLMGTGKKEE